MSSQINPNITGRKKTKVDLINVLIIDQIMRDHSTVHLSLKRIRTLYRLVDSTMKFSLSTLRKCMNVRMDLTFQAPDIRTFHALQQRNVLMRRVFLKSFVECMNEECSFIYIDESGFSNVHKKFKTWLCRRTQKPRPFGSRFKRVNLILAVSYDRVLKFEMMWDIVNSQAYKMFIIGLMEQVKRDEMLSKKLQDGKLWLVMDNSAVHKSKMMTQFY